MPTYVNPFQGVDPIAKAISDLGNAAFGNSGQGALRKQQITGLSRDNQSRDEIIKAIEADPGGAAHYFGTPIGQAMIAAGDKSAKDYGDLGLLGAANQYGATAPQTVNAQVGAGENYTATAPAFNATLDENKRQFNVKPVPAIDASGNAVFGKQGDMAGLFPVQTDSEQKGRLIGNNWGNMGPNSAAPLSDEQLRVLGAAPKSAAETPRNYVAPNGQTYITYDGVTDSQTKQPLPPGGFIATAQGSATDVGLTKPVTGNLQGSLVQAQQFHGLAQAMISLTDQHPEAFGLYGKAAGTVQGLTQAADTLITQMGGKPAFDQLLTQAQQQLASTGASPDILSKFNKAIPAVDTLGPVLAYSAASAVANQTGRSVSDKEIEMWSKIVGDPQGWLSSAQEVKTRMQLLDATVSYAEKINKEFLDQGIKPDQIDPGQVFAQAYTQAVNDIANDGNQPVVQPGAAPGAGAPAAPVQPAVQITGAEDYAKLPPGTAYIDPDGVHRVKGSQ